MFNEGVGWGGDSARKGKKSKGQKFRGSLLTLSLWPSGGKFQVEAWKFPV